MIEVELLAITPDGEALIERAARTCHQSSLGVDDASRAEFIQKVIKLGHRREVARMEAVGDE